VCLLSPCLSLSPFALFYSFRLPLPFETYLSKLSKYTEQIFEHRHRPCCQALVTQLIFILKTITLQVLSFIPLLVLHDQTPFDTDTILPRLAEDAFHLLPGQLSTRPKRIVLCSCLQHNNHTDAIHILQIKVEWVRERQETETTSCSIYHTSFAI